MSEGAEVSDVLWNKNSWGSRSCRVTSNSVSFWRTLNMKPSFWVNQKAYATWVRRFLFRQTRPLVERPRNLGCTALQSLKATGCTQLSACSCHLYTNHELEGRKKGWNLRAAKNPTNMCKSLPLRLWWRSSKQWFTPKPFLQALVYLCWTQPFDLLLAGSHHQRSAQLGICRPWLPGKHGGGVCISPWRLTDSHSVVFLTGTMASWTWRILKHKNKDH